MTDMVHKVLTCTGSLEQCKPRYMDIRFGILNVKSFCKENLLITCPISMY
jgi:hypothetical protein